jgi:hypothetical protein
MLQGFLQKEKCNLRKLFMKVIHSIVPWAKEQLKFPSVDTWISSTPDEMKAAFPSVLFFFVDGTVLKAMFFTFHFWTNKTNTTFKNVKNTPKLFRS